MKIKGQSRYISKKELDSIKEKLSQANLELFELLFRTGIRLGEVKEYVSVAKELKNEQIVNLNPQKSNNERLLPLVSIEHLRKIQLNPNALKQRIRKWNSGISAHDLRATFITRLLKKGFDIHKVKMLVGHKKIESTIAYSRLFNEHDIYSYDILVEDVLEYGTRDKHELIKRIQELEWKNRELINMNDQLVEKVRKQNEN